MTYEEVTIHTEKIEDKAFALAAPLYDKEAYYAHKRLIPGNGKNDSKWYDPRYREDVPNGVRVEQEEMSPPTREDYHTFATLESGRVEKLLSLYNEKDTDEDAFFVWLMDIQTDTATKKSDKSWVRQRLQSIREEGKDEHQNKKAHYLQRSQDIEDQLRQRKKSLDTLKKITESDQALDQSSEEDKLESMEWFAEEIMESHNIIDAATKHAHSVMDLYPMYDDLYDGKIHDPSSATRSMWSIIHNGVQTPEKSLPPQYNGLYHLRKNILQIEYVDALNHMLEPYARNAIRVCCDTTHVGWNNVLEHTNQTINLDNIKNLAEKIKEQSTLMLEIHQKRPQQSPGIFSSRYAIQDLAFIPTPFIPYPNQIDGKKITPETVHLAVLARAREDLMFSEALQRYMSEPTSDDDWLHREGDRHTIEHYLRGKLALMQQNVIQKSGDAELDLKEHDSISLREYDESLTKSDDGNQVAYVHRRIKQVRTLLDKIKTWKPSAAPPSALLRHQAFKDYENEFLKAKVTVHNQTDLL